MGADKKISLETTVVATKEQASADLGGEAGILNLKNGVYYGLDPVGVRIWKLIQEPRTVGDVREMLLEEYDVDADRCERDLGALRHMAQMIVDDTMRRASVSSNKRAHLAPCDGAPLNVSFRHFVGALCGCTKERA